MYYYIYMVDTYSYMEIYTELLKIYKKIELKTAVKINFYLRDSPFWS